MTSKWSKKVLLQRYRSRGFYEHILRFRHYEGSLESALHLGLWQSEIMHY